MPELENAQHEKFAHEYLVDYNATAAGQRCGYADNYGRQLVRNLTVKARISELRDELTEATEITAERIARAYAEIAFYDARDIALVLDRLETPGDLASSLDELPRRVTAPIRKMSKRVDNKGVTYTVEAYDRHRALEVLRERYWSVDEADDALVSGIQALREGDVPDMSEDSDKAPHRDPAAGRDLEDIPDTHNTDDDDLATKWRRR